LYLAYYFLSDIAKEKPELAGQVLDICKVGTKDEKQTEYAHSCIEDIAEENPDAIRRYLEKTEQKDVPIIDIASEIEKVRSSLQQKETKTAKTTEISKTSSQTNVSVTKDENSGYTITGKTGYDDR
jgi:tagatose-1,6-bisphosphate aldolase